MGNTKAGLFIYPAENPPRLVAIGKYVPAYVVSLIKSRGGSDVRRVKWFCRFSRTSMDNHWHKTLSGLLRRVLKMSKCSLRLLAEIPNPKKYLRPLNLYLVFPYRK